MTGRLSRVLFGGALALALFAMPSAALADGGGKRYVKNGKNGMTNGYSRKYNGKKVRILKRKFYGKTPVCKEKPKYEIPELGTAAAGSALMLLMGGALSATGRRKKKSA